MRSNSRKPPGSSAASTMATSASSRRTRTAAIVGANEARADGFDEFDMCYPGSKGQAGVWQWIIERLPTHVYYAEPFAGKAGIWRHKRPALRSFLIDLDWRVVNWLDRQIDRCSLGNYNDISVGCGLRWIELAAEWAPPDLLVYCDPPYLPETRVKLKLYRHEMSRADHVRFLKAVTRLRCPCVVSGYDSDLYREYLHGWKVDCIRVRTRGGTWRTECLWRNSAAQLASSILSMEYSDLASNWRERDRVNRLVNRWVKDFASRPARERRALLLALLDAERRK